jgi:hypothetical protein
VVVAVVIACCSYAVSATSLYTLGRQAGFSWWQAATVPVLAEGPAIYGMFRIISSSRPMNYRERSLRPRSSSPPGDRDPRCREAVWQRV